MQSRNSGLPATRAISLINSAVVERLLTYALGRQLDARDQPTVRKIVREAKAGNYRFSDLVKGVVNSAPFQMRRTQEAS